MNLVSYIKENFLFYLISILLLSFVIFKEEQNLTEAENSKFIQNQIIVDRGISTEPLFEQTASYIVQNDNGLSPELKFKAVNESTLKASLENRNSILSDEPYFSTIISVCREQDINPLFMFAVLGQEQGFVPRDNIHALTIANNPFNVFGSWIKYNTNIKDSCQIAARTMINLSQNRPENVNPIQWINTRGGQGGYAEDEKWWLGVNFIFEKLKTEVY